MMTPLTDIRLGANKALLLHKLAGGQQLLRFPSTLKFVVGTTDAAFVTARSLDAETLIDYRLVDNQGPLNGNASAPTLWLINERGRNWCLLNPQQGDGADAAEPEIDVEALSEQARDMLLNADARVGGSLGIGARETEEGTWRELRELGLIGDKNGLTRRGSRIAQAMQTAHWGELSR